MSWRSFRRHWKANYPHLKVSTKREDICNNCFVVANASKYNFAAAHLEEVSLGSMAKDVLCIDCNEDEDEFSDDGDHDLILLGSQDGSSIGLGVRGGEEAANSVELEGVINMTIEYNSVEYTTKEKRTAGITIPQFQQAVRHVVTAKAQRKYLNAAAAEAVEHCRTNINHEQRHYTFICDYAQNMSYPQLSDEQAGETYYFTPCSVYVFGMVDCAHAYADEQGIPEGSHMYAHVYEEAVGAKGGNNVASLILRTLEKNRHTSQRQERRQTITFL